MAKATADPIKLEIAERVELESNRRSRLGVPAVAGGVIYLLSTIIINSILSGAPTVGVLQGLAPALEGVANPTVSPRTPEVKYLSQHSTQLILGGALAALSIGALTLILLFLLQSARFRRPQRSNALVQLVIGAGALVALTNFGDWIVKAVQTHEFVSGHDFTNHAVEQALLKGTANLAVGYLGLAAGLALCIAMIMTALAAMRVGLIPRWMAYVGMFSALLFILSTGAPELSVIPAFWMVAMGMLFLGRFPGGDPPAWAAGEAMPWPSAADMRAQREAERQGGDSSARNGRGSSGRSDEDQVALPVGQAVPVPAPRPKATSRRRRKRSAGSRPRDAQSPTAGPEDD